MKREAAVLTILLLVAVATPAVAEVDAATAFAKLKALEGDWQGKAEGEGAEAEVSAEAASAVTHRFRVSAAGTVVMETMQPGTDHEMINMYHLDGDELVLTHYCAGGNQPTMRLDREASTDEWLVFGFTGGTNLDPVVDQHIHEARIGLMEGKLESFWTAWAGGEQAGVMKFHLVRQE